MEGAGRVRQQRHPRRTWSFTPICADSVRRHCRACSPTFVSCECMFTHLRAVCISAPRIIHVPTSRAHYHSPRHVVVCSLYQHQLLPLCLFAFSLTDAASVALPVLASQYSQEEVVAPRFASLSSTHLLTSLGTRSRLVRYHTTLQSIQDGLLEKLSARSCNILRIALHRKCRPAKGLTATLLIDDISKRTLVLTIHLHLLFIR